MDPQAVPDPTARRHLKIVGEGPQAPAASFVLSNRGFCLRLMGRGHDLTVESTGSRGKNDEPMVLSRGLEAE
jgi:hypothetical protein